MQTEPQTVNKKASTFSCPSCGGRAVFDPATQMLKCPFCGTDVPLNIHIVKPEEYDISAAPTAAQKDWGSNVRVVRCEGCGAESVLDETATADVCAFCGSPRVLEDQSEAGIAPESCIPFSVPKEKAVASFRTWLKKKWFAPSKAKKMAQLGQMTGVYLPHWTYDSDTTSAYQGRAGHYYYVEVPVTVTRDGKTHTEMRREQRVRWEPASGVVNHYFDDIVITGSHRLSEDLLTRVQPYDLSKLAQYQPAFLYGFASEKPSTNVQEGWEKAQDEIETEMRDLAREDIMTHADTAEVRSLQSQHKNVRYKLTLLPMWLASFPFKAKSYHVLVNGQTGRVGGQAPVSPLRVTVAVVLGIALLVLLYYLFIEGDSSYAESVSGAVNFLDGTFF